MAERTLVEIVDDLRQTQAEFLDILSRSDVDALYQGVASDSWTLAEVLVHIAEARQFFTAETRKVLASPGSKMGRTMDHAGRIKNVEEHGGDAPDVIRQKLIASHEDTIKLLQEMNDDDLRVMGEHVKYGQQTLAEFIQHFVVEHDQVHVQQALALLTGNTGVD